MGQNTADAWPFIGICTPSENGYGLMTELAGTYTKSGCTKTEWKAAVDKSGNASQFDTKMSSVFGSHWDNLDNDDQDTVRAAFSDVRLAFA